MAGVTWKEAADQAEAVREDLLDRLEKAYDKLNRKLDIDDDQELDQANSAVLDEVLKEIRIAKDILS